MFIRALSDHKNLNPTVLKKKDRTKANSCKKSMMRIHNEVPGDSNPNRRQVSAVTVACGIITAWLYS